MHNYLELAGRRILVTGASGFIATHLCQKLAALDAEVHGLSRRPRTGSDLPWWRGDLADISQAREIMRSLRPEIVFHLAGGGTGARELEHVLPSFQANALATVNTLVAAQEAGCERVILAGSLEEPDDSSPCSPYGAAKWVASGYARFFHRLYRMPVVILRLFMVYGPGQPEHKLIPYVISTLLNGDTPKLSSGTREVDWIYVDDVVESFLAAALAPGLSGQTVDIGSGHLLSIRSLVEQLAPTVAPDAAVEFGGVPDRPLEEVRAANTKRAAALLGWKPTVSLQRGLELTVDWYRRKRKLLTTLAHVLLALSVSPAEAAASFNSDEPKRDRHSRHRLSHQRNGAGAAYRLPRVGGNLLESRETVWA